MPKEVILLVGGNPLPNYVAALALKKTPYGINQAHLLYTPEVKDVKDNLVRCLVKKGGFKCLKATYIGDAGNAKVIREACAGIGSDSHLHYTGGTNTMAAHVHAVWKTKGGQDAQASYLFGKDDCLITDAGGTIDINDIQLDLETLAILHGLKGCAPRKVLSGGPCLPDDANEIAVKVSEEPDLAERLYEKIPDDDKKFKKQPFCSQTEKLCLSQRHIPTPDEKEWPKERRNVWLKFLRGEWLEEWVRWKIEDTKLVDPAHLHVGIEPKINNRPFELDVVAIRGHHLYVVSCTTDSDIRMCKSKLFEVAMRSRRLGGDLARSALVCLADSGTVEKLRQDVHSLSELSRVPQVFGLNQVREWAGYSGASPNLNTLKDWLKD